MSRSLRHAGLVLLTGIAFAGLACADDDAADARQRVQFSGFGTLGVIHNRGDGAELIRDLTQPRGSANQGLTWKTDSRLGIQANYRPAESLEAVAQVVSRYRWDNNFAPELAWGFLKYTPSDYVDLRAGRFGYDAFLAADSRDVGFSFLWARPPVEYYGVLTVPYIDGLDAVARMPLGNGTVRAKMFAGIDRQRIPTQWGLIMDLNHSRSRGLIFDYQDNHLTVRLGRTMTNLANELPTGGLNLPQMLDTYTQLQTDADVIRSLQAIAHDTRIVGKTVYYDSVGLIYEDGPFQVQTAIAHTTANTTLYPEAYAGYLSTGYRIGNFTPYAMISAVTSKQQTQADDLRGKGVGLDPMLSILNYMFSSTQQNQRTFTLGTRYAFSGKAALKLQADFIRNRTCAPLSLPIVGTSPACSTPMLWPRLPTQWNGHANAISAALDFIF